MKTITQCTKNSLIIYLLAVVCAFSSVVVFSSRSYASELSISATPTGSGQACINGGNVVDLSQVCGLIQNTNSDVVGTVGWISPSIPGVYYSDSVLKLEFSIYRFSNSTSSHAVVNGVQNNSSTWDMIGYEFEDLNTGTGKLSLLFKAKNNNISFSTILRGNNGGWIFGLQPGDRVAGVNYTVYALNNSNAGSDSIVNAINSQPNYSNSLNTINNNIGSVNNNINDLKDSQDKANQDANNRYEDEKNTTIDNGDSANSSWTDNTDNLKFDAPTGLFSWLWSVGTTEDCVAIPVLSSLIHAHTSHYCSWWPTSFRSIASPIINIFIVMFLTGFIIRWLRSKGI